jgi:hypothetical protein
MFIFLHSSLFYQFLNYFFSFISFRSKNEIFVFFVASSFPTDAHTVIDTASKRDSQVSTTRNEFSLHSPGFIPNIFHPCCSLAPLTPSSCRRQCKFAKNRSMFLQLILLYKYRKIQAGCHCILKPGKTSVAISLSACNASLESRGGPLSDVFSLSLVI